MPVAVMCPTRDRPEGFARLAQSVIATSGADLLAYIDDDQEEAYRPTKWSDLHPYGTGRVRWKVGPRVGPVASANALVSEFGEYDAYGLVTDDATLTIPGWDQWVMGMIAQFPNRICVVSPYHNQGNHVDMPFVSRQWIDTVGWFAYPKAFHYVWPIITGLIGEMTAIVHAPKDAFAVHHPPKVEMVSVDRLEADARAFFSFVALELPAVVERVREAMVA